MTDPREAADRDPRLLPDDGLGPGPEETDVPTSPEEDPRSGQRRAEEEGSEAPDEE